MFTTHVHTYITYFQETNEFSALCQYLRRPSLLHPFHHQPYSQQFPWRTHTETKRDTIIPSPETFNGTIKSTYTV